MHWRALAHTAPLTSRASRPPPLSLSRSSLCNRRGDRERDRRRLELRSRSFTRSRSLSRTRSLRIQASAWSCAQVRQRLGRTRSQGSAWACVHSIPAAWEGAAPAQSGLPIPWDNAKTMPIFGLSCLSLGGCSPCTVGAAKRARTLSCCCMLQVCHPVLQLQCRTAPFCPLRQTSCKENDAG